MKYSDYREKIKSGDLLITDHTSFVRIATATSYNHCGLIWRVAGRLFVIESIWPKVRLVPLSIYAKKGFYVIHTKKAPSSTEMEYLLSKVGVAKYSYWQCVLAYFRRLVIGADDMFECAELVACSRRLSGIDLGDVAVPSEIVEKALEQGMVMTYIEGGI